MTAARNAPSVDLSMLLNQSGYALTSRLSAALEEVGMVGVNIGVAAPVAFFPFSGWKDSFLGDLHAHGPDAVEFYTRKKTVTSRYFSSGQGHGTYFVEQ